MLRVGICRLAKALDSAALFAGKAGATKLVSDEVFGQAAMEYIFEENRPDVMKTARDVDDERLLGMAVDRLYRHSQLVQDRRLRAVVRRSTEVLASLPEELQIEASVLNTEQPPYGFRRSTLTPPLDGYEPGFGLDVPANRARVRRWR